MSISMFVLNLVPAALLVGALAALMLSPRRLRHPSEPPNAGRRRLLPAWGSPQEAARRGRPAMPDRQLDGAQSVP
jgi:hypothetical protein